MIFICRYIRTVLIILLIPVATNFCASKNYLIVNYQLPAESAELKETRVALTVKDIRENPTIVTKSARKALKNFSGNFVLNVAKENKEYKLQGAFGLSSMIRKIFRHRLENAGVQVVTEEDFEDSIVQIVLKEFKLDLQNRKWIIKMDYEAKLIKQNRVVAGETISGSAEQLRVISGKNAEMVIGELVTDMVNRLNLNELLQAAGA